MKYIWITFLMTLFLLSGCRTSRIDGYSMHELKNRMYGTAYTASNGCVLPYRVAVPQTTDKVPLIVFLHGLGGRGCDNENQLRDGLGCILKYMEQEDENAILVAPQCPTNRMWIDTEMVQALQELTCHYMASNIVDTNRVYLTGFSMGGAGTWILGLAHPELFTALAPVAGGPMKQWSWSDPTVPDGMLGMNIWSVIYFDDPVVNPNYSKKIVAQLWNKNSMSAHLIEILTGGHTCEIYSEREFLDRIFGSRKLTALYD